MDLVLYMDRTHIDKNSRFTCCPVIFTSSLFTEKARRNPMFWRQFGYLFDTTLRSSAENATSVRGHSCINSHKQLEVLFEGLRKVQSGEDTRLDDVWVYTDGVRRKKKILVPFLFFMNDAKEGDMLTCRTYSHHPSTERHSRTCDMPFGQIMNVNHPCTMIRPDDVDAMVDANDSDGLKAMAQYCVKSCFRVLEFCDPEYGIFGAQPGDQLHMVQLGVFKDAAIVFLDCFTDSQKVQLDDMARRFNKRLRQSHRKNFPTTDFSRGITNTAQKQGKEYTGMLYVLCALINNHDAWVMIDTALTKHGLEIAKVLQLFEAMLCFDQWCKLEHHWSPEEAPVEEERARGAIRKMLKMLFKALPRTKGNQWALSKVHDLMHIPHCISRFGNVMQYHTGFGEANHKVQAKIPGRKAAKRHQTFTLSIANNIVDMYVLDLFLGAVKESDAKQEEHLYEEIDTTVVDVIAVDPVVEPGVVESVKYATKIKVWYDDGPVVKWYSRSKNKKELAPGLAEFLVRHYDLNDDNDRHLLCYTQYKRNDTIMRCHPNHDGYGPWYDWIMFKYENHGREYSAPARLMLIVFDPSHPELGYQPIIQWAGNRTNLDSVLFNEYVFQNDETVDAVDSYSVHDVNSIEDTVFVVDCETKNHNRILVANDVWDWHSYFN